MSSIAGIPGLDMNTTARFDSVVESEASILLGFHELGDGFGDAVLARNRLLHEPRVVGDGDVVDADSVDGCIEVEESFLCNGCCDLGHESRCGRVLVDYQAAPCLLDRSEHA